MAERDYTFKVMHDSIVIARQVFFEDESRMERNEPSIYPADLGITSTEEYVEFLRKNEYLFDPLETDLSAISIGNVSRSDPENTILVLSTGNMRDIHTMIHNLGSGPPDYKKGYIAFKKNRNGQFYPLNERHNEALVGADPPRTPAFLAHEAEQGAAVNP